MATLCQYNITGLCCVCITAGCLQATSVCGTHYGDGSNLTNVSSPTGTVVYMPGVSTTPSGYLPADGTLYAKASYSNLGTCYSGKSFGLDALITGTNYNFNYVDFILNPYGTSCNFSCFKCFNSNSYVPDCYFSAIGYAVEGIYGCCLVESAYSMSLLLGSGSGAISYTGLNVKTRTCTGFVLMAHQGNDGINCCQAIGLKIDTSSVSNGADFFNCITRPCYYASLYSCGFKMDPRLCCCWTGGAALETATAVCKYVVNWGYRGGGYVQIDVFDTDFPRCCCILAAWCNAALKQTYVICCSTSIVAGTGRHAAANFLCNVVACGACPFMGMIIGAHHRCTFAGIDAYWFGGAGSGEAAQYSTNNTRYFNFSTTVSSPPVCNGQDLALICHNYSHHPGLKYRCACTLNSFNSCLCTYSYNPDIGVAIRGGFYYTRPYDVGYNKMISFGTSCFGALTIAANCTCSITCYPITCVGSQCVTHVCYSNALNYWFALTCNSDLYSSPGSDGTTWTMSLCRSSLRSGLSIWNLDNKVAISTVYGGIWVTCNGTTWTCIWNPHKMILGDNSERLVKQGNYYVGVGTVHTCDLCCSGYTVAPGHTGYSTALNALVSVNSRLTSPPTGCVAGYNHALNIGWNDGPTNFNASMIALEAAIYCSSVSSSDSIYWKWCVLSNSYCCSAACGGKKVLIQDVNVNGQANKVYYTYSLNCQIGACKCVTQALGMYDLSTCVHVDNISICCYLLPVTNWAVTCNLSFGLVTVNYGTSDHIIITHGFPGCHECRWSRYRSYVGCVTSGTCAFCTKCELCIGQNLCYGVDVHFRATQNQIALMCSSDPVGCAACCQGYAIAFRSDNTGGFCVCRYDCVSCTFQQLGCMPYCYQNCVPQMYTCTAPAPSPQGKIVSPEAYGAAVAFSTTVGASLVNSTTSFYYGCLALLTGVTPTLLASGSVPYQYIRGDGDAQCHCLSILGSGRESNSPNSYKFITTYSGKAYFKDGTVSAAFDTTNCFRVPNIGAGYYVKT